MTLPESSGWPLHGSAELRKDSSNAYFSLLGMQRHVPESFEMTRYWFNNRLMEFSYVYDPMILTICVLSVATDFSERSYKV